jgi:2-polyprenyl-3-methyl-5-hydroxy-6-metoxy-1,4-benzoquinol methylase/uncharacterized protein YbaR (Trm112 family)
MVGEEHKIDPWYLDNLVCPITRTALSFEGQYLISAEGRRYPVVEGLPVLLLPDENQTIEIANASIQRAHRRAEATDGRAPHLYLESLGISDQEREQIVRLTTTGAAAIDPVVMMLIGATCGIGYRDLVGDRRLKEYPIPSISLRPREPKSSLLDVGCSWGRWSVAAAKSGFSVVGIDPSLGAVMAARRIATAMNLDIKYLVADARFLPFVDGYFECVYSYSVLQHFSKRDARRALTEMRRVIKPGGMAKIQMANKWGIRSLQYQIQRHFREPRGFEVRYWTIGELRSTFTELIGKTRISADCYLGLGWQWCDLRYLSWKRRPILVISELLRRLSNVVHPVRILADSVFCSAVKGSGGS